MADPQTSNVPFNMLLFYLSPGYLVSMWIWLVLLAVGLRWGLRARRRAKGNASRLRLVHAGLSLWFVAFSLTLPELWFALFYDRTDSFNSTNVSERWFRRHVQLNPQGFRDAAPFTRAVPGGRRRVVFLGDSFTFGQGVERVADRFSDRIGRELEARQPGKFTVANLSLTGIGVNDMPVLWERHVLLQDSKVDIVVYAICLNDIEWMAGKVTDQQYEPLRKIKPRFFLLRDTYFYNWLYFRVQLMCQPKLLSYYDFVRKYYAGRPWQLMQQELDKLHEMLRKQGTELRLVVFPFLHNLGPGYPYREAHQQIVAFARERHLRVLDLEPVLSPHVSEGLTVNPFDAHPNVRANALAADAIVRELLSDLIQPLDQNPRKL